MYLANDLMASVKRRCNVPTSQATFLDTDFYALADEEIRAKLLPLVLKHMEEYYVATLDYQITSNQVTYAIPPRAVAMELRDVQFVSSSDQDIRIGLERLNPEDLYSGVSGNARRLIKKNGFYLQGNSVVLYPTPHQSLDILRLSYYMRPSQLVDVATCGIITAVDSVNKQLNLSVVPSNITVLTPVDFVRAVPGFECTAIDQTISAIGGTTLTFSGALPANVAVGDYVCLANQSCVVQVPVELQPLLFQYVVIRVLAAQGDQSNLKIAMAELESLEKAASILLSPRVSGKTKRVVNGRSITRWV